MKRRIQERNEDLSRTVFVSGMSLDTTSIDLKGFLEEFGPLTSVLVVKDKETGKSKGTAFAEFMNECDQQKAIETFDSSKSKIRRKWPSSLGLSFTLKQAVTRKNVKSLITSRKLETVKTDRRNLYLLQEGKIDETSPIWKELSKTDKAVRKRSEQIKREKLKKPLFFVSKTRLCIRNLPEWMTESRLESTIIEAITQRATKARPVVRQVKLLYDDSSTGKSLRRGFVELDLHENAMCALRQLNGNPEVFGPNRRPIVEFAIDNREIINKREEQIQKLKRKAVESGKVVVSDATFGFGKKKRKGKNERRREKEKPPDQSGVSPPKRPRVVKPMTTKIPAVRENGKTYTVGSKQKRKVDRKKEAPRHMVQTKRRKVDDRDHLDSLVSEYHSKRFISSASFRKENNKWFF